MRHVQIGLLVFLLAPGAAAQSPMPDDLMQMNCPGVVRQRVAGVFARSDREAPPTVHRPAGWIVVSAESHGGGIFEVSSRESVLVHESSCFAVTLYDHWENSRPCSSDFSLDLHEDVPPPVDWVELLPGGPVEVFDPARHGLAQLWFDAEEEHRRGGVPTSPAEVEQREGEVWASPLAGRVQRWRAGEPHPHGAVYDPSSGRLRVFGADLRHVRAGATSLVEMTPFSRFEETAVAIVDGTRRHRWLAVTLADTGAEVQAVGRPRWVGEHRGWLFAVVAAANPEFGASLLALRPADGAARVVHLPIAENEDLLPRAAFACGPDPEEVPCLEVRMTTSRLRVDLCHGEERGPCEQASYPLRTILRALERSLALQPSIETPCPHCPQESP